MYDLSNWMFLTFLMRCDKWISLEDHLRWMKEKVDLEKGKDAPNEKRTKCYKLPMSNENMHMYLNTTRYAWYIVSMLCFNCNIEWKCGENVKLGNTFCSFLTLKIVIFYVFSTSTLLNSYFQCKLCFDIKTRFVENCLTSILIFFF